MPKLLRKSATVFLAVALLLNFAFAVDKLIGPSNAEIAQWKSTMVGKSATERIAPPVERRVLKNQRDPELLPLRMTDQADPEFLFTDAFDAYIMYARDIIGQFIFEGTDSMGVWFRPATDCIIKQVQVLFSDDGGDLLGKELTIRIHDVLDTLTVTDPSQSEIPGNGVYGFTEYMETIPSPTGTLLGTYPMNVDKVGFSLETGWCITDLATYPDGVLDVGKRDFFVSFMFPEGNTDGADTYYGPAEEQHAPGDYHSFKYYHDGGTYSPGIPNWVSRLNFTMRVLVNYYGDPPPNIEDVTVMSDVYASCDPGPYPISAHVYDYGTDTYTGGVTKVNLIYFTEDIKDADTLDITSSGVNEIYTGEIPAHDVGTTVQYYIYAEDNGIDNPDDPAVHTSKISPKSFTIREANPDASILVVHDGTYSQTELYTAVLDEGGWIYDYWDVANYGELTLCQLQKYSSLFWLQGIGTSGGLASFGMDTTVVPDYLDAGGNIFMVSSDYVGAVEGDNYTGEWTDATYSFLTDYLKVDQFASDANLADDESGNSLDSLYQGVADNEISDFMSADTLVTTPIVIYGNNWNDEVAPASTADAPFMVWSEGDVDWVEASTMYDGDYKMIFCAFWLDATADVEKFETIVKNVLGFFGEKANPLVTIEIGPRYVVANNSGPYAVVASASDGDGTVATVELGTSTDGAAYTYAAMTANDDVYEGEIAALSVGDTLYFQVRATDNDGLYGYGGPWGFSMIDFTPTNTDLLYCGDDPYDWYYGSSVDSIMIASLDRISASYDKYDVDGSGSVPPSYVGFLDQYESVIWHGYADWVFSFPEATADNPFYPFVENGGNLCFSSEEMVAQSHFDDGDYSPGPGESAYDVLGIGWVGYDWCYDTVKVFTDDLTANMDEVIGLTELPFGYMAELFDAVNLGVEGNTYILDAWLADYGAWYSDFGVPGTGWKEDFGSKKVIVPFPLAALDDDNRDAFLTNVIEWFGGGSAIKPVAETLPKAFALKQNFPNPFNPITSIAFEMPKAENIRLTVYNMLGQSVRTLVNDHRDAGRYTVLWDGRDDAGHMVGSGVYFYQIQAGTFTKTAKMVFLK
jgi:hypothetical protein